MVPKLRNILYASDLSDNSAPALSWAMMLAHQHDARITFLHVVEKLSSHTSYAVRSFVGEETWKKLSSGRQSVANKEIEDSIHQFCGGVQNSMESCPFTVKDFVTKQGVPVEIILGEANSGNYDLVVMGTHGAGLFKDAMIGSTARRVVRRSKIPVFVIPLQQQEE